MSDRGAAEGRGDATGGLTATPRPAAGAWRHHGERLYHRIAAIATLVLLAIIVWDDVANGSRLFVPLLVVLSGHLVVQLTVLLWLRPETEARIDQEIVHLIQVEPPTGQENSHRVRPEAPAATKAAEPFTYNGYTLYRTDTKDRGGNPRTFYFFSKRTPKKGVPSPKPPGHHVGVNRITGLPFLKRGAGVDGEVLRDAKQRRPQQCHALTHAGDQCRNNSRATSKYCARHHGYRPPSADVAKSAKDTKPRSRRAVDTKPSARTV